MNFIYRSQLPKSEAEVRADLAAWIAEVEAHKSTVGVPAPFPEYELLRHLVPGFVVLEDEDYAPPSEVSPGEETREQAIARLWKSIKSERDRRKAGGVKLSVGGVDKWFHSDDPSRIQQLGLVMMGENIPEVLQWKTMDGTFVTMTPALATQIFQAVAAHDIAVFGIAEQHRANMEASESPADYDYSTGWPQTFAEWQAEQ